MYKVPESVQTGLNRAVTWRRKMIIPEAFFIAWLT